MLSPTIAVRRRNGVELRIEHSIDSLLDMIEPVVKKAAKTARRCACGNKAEKGTDFCRVCFDLMVCSRWVGPKDKRHDRNIPR